MVPRLAPAPLLALPIAASLLLVGAHRGAAAGDEGARLAASCASCHGSGGREGGIPAIAGLPEKSIARAMLAYKSGERHGQLMQVVAGSLSNDEIAMVAHYLAGQGGAATQ